jgi:hypothetical protein
LHQGQNIDITAASHSQLKFIIYIIGGGGGWRRISLQGWREKVVFGSIYLLARNTYSLLKYTKNLLP